MSQRSGLAAYWLQTAELQRPPCGQAEGLGTSSLLFRDTEPPTPRFLGGAHQSLPVPQLHSCKNRSVESRQAHLIRSRPKELGVGDLPRAAQHHRGPGDLPHTPDSV